MLTTILPPHHGEVVTTVEYQAHSTDGIADNVQTKLSPGNSEVTVLIKGLCKAENTVLIADNVKSNDPLHHAEISVMSQVGYTTASTDGYADSVEARQNPINSESRCVPDCEQS